MRRAAIGLVGCLAFLVLASPAWANDFFPSDGSNWYRYSGPGGQQLTSRIERAEDGWALWSEFAGLGPRWVYTESGHDWLWLWSDETEVGEVFADLSAAVGARWSVKLDSSATRVTIERRSAAIVTPAGRFSRVTKVSLSGGGTGVSEIWFAKDVGVIQWTESGGATFELSAGLVDGRQLGSSAASTASAVAPAQWEESESVLWGANDTYLVVDTYADAFTALDGRSPRVLSDVNVASDQVASELRYEMASRGVPMDDVEIFVVAIDSVWMRDYGPIVLRDASGQRVVGDTNYYYERRGDDAFPDAYARYRGWPVVKVDVDYEGGNFISDGRGQGFASTGVIQFNPDKSASRVERELTKLGVDRVEFFQPLIDEGTTHIDMFNKLVSPTQAIVSSYPSGHRQRPVVDAAARKMRSMGYQVHRIRAHVDHDEYATYANALLANGVALVPQYGSATRDRAALTVYRSVGFEARGVDCSLLIQYGGAVHCISMQVPAR